MKVFVYKWNDEEKILIILENEYSIHKYDGDNKMSLINRRSSVKDSTLWEKRIEHLRKSDLLEFHFFLDIPENSTVVYEIKKQIPEIFL